MTDIADKLVTAIIDLLKWVQGCDLHESTSYREFSLHLLSCIMRMAIFIAGTYTLAKVVIEITGV